MLHEQKFSYLITAAGLLEGTRTSDDHCKVSLQSFDITPPKSFLSIIIIIADDQLTVSEHRSKNNVTKCYHS